MHKLVWFSEIKWDYLRTRKQQILNRFGDDWDILYVEPFKAGGEQHWFPKRRKNLVVLTIPILKSPREPGREGLLASPIFQWINQALCLLYFHFWAIILGFRKKDRIIGLSNIYWGKLAARMQASCKFYDANDAHLDFPNVPGWASDFLEPWVDAADLIFSVSPEISLQVEAMGGVSPVLLGNGVEYDHFATPMEAVEDIKADSGRVFGYAGAMDWLDAALLERIADRYPDDRIVLIGPCINPEWWNRQAGLNQKDNVHYLGRMDYTVLPSYIQQFDVCMIPFEKNELTKPLNPNKLYEYCATGAPVVSMDYSSTIQGLSDIILVAGDHEAFVSLLTEASSSGAEARRSLAEVNSWDTIAQRFQEMILQCSGGAVDLSE